MLKKMWSNKKLIFIV